MWPRPPGQRNDDSSNCIAPDQIARSEPAPITCVARRVRGHAISAAKAGAAENLENSLEIAAQIMRRTLNPRCAFVASLYQTGAAAPRPSKHGTAHQHSLLAGLPATHLARDPRQIIFAAGFYREFHALRQLVRMQRFQY